MITRMRARLIAKGHELAGRGRQTGAVDIGGILLMGIGMVFLAVGFIMFPIVTSATDDLLDYTYSVGGDISVDNFTGFEAVVGITPLLVLIAYVSAAVFAMYLGVKVMKGGEGGSKLDLSTMLMLGISLIFIAIALIIMPVALDGISSVLYGSSAGINASYVGLKAILEVTPLLLLISFIGGAVVSGFFGLRKLGASY